MGIRMKCGENQANHFMQYLSVDIYDAKPARIPQEDYLNRWDLS